MIEEKLFEKVDLAFPFGEVNVQRVEPKKVTLYLNSLKKRLLQLAQILSDEDEEFVVPYTKVMVDTLDCFSLKYELAQEDQINFSLTIDPTNSGFPTVKDFYLLGKDKENSAAVLATLPSREEIIERIRTAVLKGHPPTTAQTLLRRFEFNKKLHETEIVKEFYISKPRFIDAERDGQRKYTLQWSCIEKGSNVPILYRMYLKQDPWATPLHRDMPDRMKTLLYHSQYGATDLRTLVAQIDQEIDEIHPKLIHKYVVGPFHHPAVTSNNPSLDAVLQDAEDPSILKFSIERVSSEQTRELRSLWRSILGRVLHKEIYGPLDDGDKRMIVPFRVKQTLSSHPEARHYRIYGVTQEGALS